MGRRLPTLFASALLACASTVYQGPGEGEVATFEFSWPRESLGISPGVFFDLERCTDWRYLAETHTIYSAEVVDHESREGARARAVFRVPAGPVGFRLFHDVTEEGTFCLQWLSMVAATDHTYEISHHYDPSKPRACRFRITDATGGERRAPRSARFREPREIWPFPRAVGCQPLSPEPGR